MGKTQIQVTPSKLPPELTDYLLDLVATECYAGELKTTMSDCSLVCKTWLPRSSRHLFHSIKLSSVKLEEYLALAQASTRLATHLRELVIKGSFDPTLYLKQISAIMPKLAHLEFRNNATVEFTMPPDFKPDLSDPNNRRTVHYYVQPSWDQCAIRSGVLSIEYLRLGRIAAQAIPLFLRPFTRIKTLELFACYHRHHRGPDKTLAGYELSKRRLVESAGPVLPLPAPVVVDNLIYDQSSSLLMGAALTIIPICPVNLTVTELDYGGLMDVLGFMRDGGQNLERLTIIPTKTFSKALLRHNSTSPDHTMLRRDSCPNLRSLELSVVDIRTNSRCCKTILWYLPAATLRHVNVTLRSWELTKILPDIRGAFGVKDYSNLEVLEFRGIGAGQPLSSSAEATLRAEVQTHLPSNIHCEIVLS